MNLDIVILPEKKLRQKLGREIVNASKGLTYLFVVDGKKFQHHMSLYHIRMPFRKLPELFSKVREISRQYSKFALQTEAFTVYPSGVFVFNFKPNPNWEKMQRQLVGTCSGLRSGTVALPPSKKLTKQQKLFIRKYGSPFLHPLMKPHFTMGKLAHPKDFSIVKQKMKTKSFSFVASIAAVCQVNNDGQVTKILKTLKLKP